MTPRSSWGPRRQCAVLGSPIGHSLSPTLHRAAYAEAGLDWTYEAREVSGTELAGFLDELDETWRGLSLTMPLKRAVLPLLDALSPRADLARAANTVLLEDGRRVGHNTDVTGMVAAISERSEKPINSAVILGGGATAGSALLALADLGCRDVTVAVRDEGRAREALEAATRHPNAPTVRVGQLTMAPVRADLLVSTIPAAAQTDVVLALAADVAVIFDVVYDPWPTPLAAFARRSDRTLVSGLDLLVHQAAEQFTLMTGLDDQPLRVMRAAGERALEQPDPASG